MPPSSPWTQARTETWTERELLQRLQANVGGAAVIASTDRATRTLRQRYNRRLHASGSSGWRTPQILAWKSWLDTLWDAGILHGLEKRVALSEIQELEIWQNILADDEAARQTISVDDLAAAAQKAWRQMCQYRIPLNRLRNENTLDTTSFYAWAAAFEKRCRKSSFLSSSQIEEAIAQWISSNEIVLPREIFLIGFDRITPSQAFLTDALRQRGCDVQFIEVVPPGVRAHERTIVCAHTVEEEIEAAAHWVRRRLLDGPSQQIGVIVASLETMRGSIDAVFRRILAPSSIDIRAQHAKAPYEFSLGTPMHRMQPVRTALTLLRWLNRPLSPEDASWFLVHGDFSEDFEKSRDARATLDRKFRERNFQLGGPVSFTAFRQWLSQPENARWIAPFHRTIDRLFITVKRTALDKPRSFAEWREVIDELLTTANWHLLGAKSSADYQLLRRWNTTLNEFSSLNSVAGAVRFSTALEKLGYLASHTLFTLQTSNAPVLVLGVPESAGLVFDAVWWMNAQTDTWPSRGRALPFLPWALQREARMPYADPAEDYAFALRTSKRILNSADTVAASFSLQDSDAANSSAHTPDREIILTPLVREVWPEVLIVAAAEQIQSQDLSEKANNESPRETALERIDEEPTVPFQGIEVRGGVRFLELQAACPFRAFAELRLGARPLEGPGNGLSPADQGNVIHRILDRFWKEMQSRKNLLQITPAEHRGILRKHIDEALHAFFQHASEPWQRTLLAIESDRLEQRLMDWLEQEKQRPDFTVVGTETALDHPQLGGISFQCRVDRIDRVEQGITLLDYKTGPVNRNSCEGDRPDQPQLPAYAVLRKQASAASDRLAGLAFAGLHPQNIGFTVIDSLPSVFQTVAAPIEVSDDTTVAASRSKSRFEPAKLTPEQMHDLEEVWAGILTRLAEAFRAGAAMVDPKKQAETCKYCEQALLCRLRETEVPVDAEEQEDAGDISDDGPER